MISVEDENKLLWLFLCTCFSDITAIKFLQPKSSSFNDVAFCMIVLWKALSVVKKNQRFYILLKWPLVYGIHSKLQAQKKIYQMLTPFLKFGGLRISRAKMHNWNFYQYSIMCRWIEVTRWNLKAGWNCGTKSIMQQLQN